MCSSLVHIALIFKLFYQHKPLLPWKWSEYPLESYFSVVRFLFGNDDEFSTLEYTQRVQRLQQQHNSDNNLRSGRNKVNKSIWDHPKQIDIAEHPQLFDQNWKLIDLFREFQRMDEKIAKEFTELGMSEMFKVI